MNKEEFNYTIRASYINVSIKKENPGWWPRLISKPQKPHWIKIDFDRWTTKELIEDEQTRDVREDYPETVEKVQKEEFGYVKENYKKIYLTFYNLAQFIGYMYIVIVLSICYFKDGPKTFSKAFENVGNVMQFIQCLQYLEVLHPIFGYTKGSWLTSFLQVSGRNFVLFVMILTEPRIQAKPVVYHLFMVWSLIEIFRYPYYLSMIVKKPVGLLTWLRYTMWMPLYPAGVICEGTIILRNIPYFEETQKFSVAMPNEWNFSFSIPTFLKFYLFILLGVGFFLMKHMGQIRAKKFPYKPPPGLKGYQARRRERLATEQKLD